MKEASITIPLFWQECFTVNKHAAYIRPDKSPLRPTKQTIKIWSYIQHSIHIFANSAKYDLFLRSGKCRQYHWWKQVLCKKGDTLARCVCRLFLASAVSDMRFEKAMLTPLNWFHISLDEVFSRISISSLSLWEAARSLWECRMLSSVNLDHESGRERLTEGKEWQSVSVEPADSLESVRHWL